MRYLAIDLGDKRTGLAVGDDITGLASPVGLIEIPTARRDGEDLLAALIEAVDEHLGPADAIVIGLPLNMDGTEGPRAKAVRAFADLLAQRTTRRVHLHDERLSSASADWSMAQSGLTHAQKKRRRDALAAAAILRAFLQTRAEPPHPPPHSPDDPPGGHPDDHPDED